MSVPDRTGRSGIKNSEQNNSNSSFDEDFGVNAVEGLTYNPISGALERVTTIQGNASLVLSYTGDNLTTIQKVIGGVTYTQTLGYDGSNNLISISAWS